MTNNGPSSYYRIVPILVTSFIILAEAIISLNSVFLPYIKDDFFLSNQMAQMTLTMGIFSLGFSGIIYGGITDSYGRKPIFVFSSLVLCLSTLICGITDSLYIFFFGRFMQGIGSGAGWVIGNACLKDIYHGKAYTRIMNQVHAIAGITPAIVPILGAYLAETSGWRNSFVGIFVVTLILSLIIAIFQKETIENKELKTFKKILSDYRRIFNSKKFLKYLFIKVVTVSLLFAEISTIPLVFMDYMQVLPQHYGFFVLPAFICYIIANIISTKLSKSIEVDNALKIGLSLIFISNSFIIFYEYMISPMSAIFIQGIKCLTYAAWGFIFGNATAEIVSAVPGRASNASAMMIALEMIASSAVIFILGFFFNGTIIPLSCCMILISLLAFVALHFVKIEQ